MDTDNVLYSNAATDHLNSGGQFGLGPIDLQGSSLFIEQNNGPTALDQYTQIVSCGPGPPEIPSYMEYSFDNQHLTDATYIGGDLNLAEPRLVDDHLITSLNLPMCLSGRPQDEFIHHSTIADSRAIHNHELVSSRGDTNQSTYGNNNTFLYGQSLPSIDSPPRKRRRQASDCGDITSTVSVKSQKHPTPSSSAPLPIRQSQQRHKCLLLKDSKPCTAVFVTTNDLERHRASVHKVWKTSQKFWNCPYCPSDQKPPKPWPRLDNLVSHIKCAHKDIEGTDLEAVKKGFRLYDPALHGSQSQQQEDGRVQHLDPPASRSRPHIASHISAPSSSAQQRPATIDPELLKSTGSLPADKLLSESWRSAYQPAELTTIDGSINGRTHGLTLGLTPLWDDAGDDLTFGSIFANQETDLPQVGRHLDPAVSTIDSLVESLPPDDEEKLFRLLLERRAKLSITSDVKPEALAPRVSVVPNEDDGPSRFPCKMPAMIGAGLCPSTFKTAGELRKHQKKHEMKYACTFDRCFRRWGTKYQWHRHEFRKHMQEEQWRCQGVDSESGIVCTFYCRTRDAFVSHIGEKHPHLKGQRSKAYLVQCELGKQWQHAFWCGFCQKGVPTSDVVPGSPIAKARYSHIEEHVMRDGWKMDDWVEIKSNGKTKGELRRESGDQVKGDEKPEGTVFDRDLGLDSPPDDCMMISDSFARVQDTCMQDISDEQLERVLGDSDDCRNTTWTASFREVKAQPDLTCGSVRPVCAHCGGQGEENDTSLECRICSRPY